MKGHTIYDLQMEHCLGAISTLKKQFQGKNSSTSQGPEEKD